MSASLQPAVRLARHAMATRFELVLHGENAVALRAAGEEALEEIERLEAQLSLFQPSSEIAHLNGRAAQEPVRVSPSLFALLEHARRLTTETQGAFDITIAPLMRAWGFLGDRGHRPTPAEIAEARGKVGMDLVTLNPEELTVSFAREGMMLDLGAIGKGYAIERAAELLREAGVRSALVHGGTSTVYALGHPPEAEFWQVAVVHPGQRAGTRPNRNSDPPAAAMGAAPSGLAGQLKLPEPTEPTPGTLALVPLADEAMSVSAVWGKCFQTAERTFGHILDPRTGEPAAQAVLAAVVLPSATETDALSTALLTLGPAGHNSIAQLRPGMRTLVTSESAGGYHTESRGIPGQLPV